MATKLLTGACGLGILIWMTGVVFLCLILSIQTWIKTTMAKVKFKMQSQKGVPRFKPPEMLSSFGLGPLASCSKA